MLDEEGLFSLTLQPVTLHIAEKTPGDIIVDAFCGVGGSTLGFTRKGNKVIAIDNNPRRLGMARYNARLFDVDDHIKFIRGDCCDIIPTLKADTVFLDPP